MWECAEGSVLGDQLYPKYELPDGRQLHFYQSQKRLVDEVPFHLLPPPELPHSLEAMGLDGLPSPELHAGAYLALRRRLEMLPPPLAIKPHPPAAPRVYRQGFLPTVYPKCPFLLTGQEHGHGVIRTKVLKSLIAPEPEAEKQSWEDAVFKTHQSVFALRKKTSDGRAYFNGPKAWDRTFEMDWTLVSSKQGLVKAVGGEAVLNKLKVIVRTSYDLLRCLFEEYALDDKSPMLMGLNEFSMLASDANISDSNSAFCRTGDMDTLFIVSNMPFTDKTPKLQQVNSLNQPRSLNLYEFLDLTIRVALAKYNKSEPSLDPEAALQKLLDENLCRVTLLRPGTGINTDIFRRERLYYEEVDDILKENLPLLKALYNYYKGVFRGYRMPPNGFVALMTEAKLVNDQFLTTREVLYCFVKSRMLVFDPWEFKEKNESLGLVDFLEAIGRVADHVSLPSEQEATALGYDSIFELYSATLNGLVSIPRRHSSGFEQKTRPLHEKIAGVLDVMKGMLCYKFNLNHETKLKRYLQEHTTFAGGVIK
mmetsp:Transcript_28051/g.61386  ORF Transcript_28051/g.61386 Transcript_28051/m.61386 type:complete len:536 (-) Transcript_28051:266-1873(-)